MTKNATATMAITATTATMIRIEAVPLFVFGSSALYSPSVKSAGCTITTRLSSPSARRENVRLRLSVRASGLGSAYAVCEDALRAELVHVGRAEDHAVERPERNGQRAVRVVRDPARGEDDEPGLRRGCAERGRDCAEEVEKRAGAEIRGVEHEAFREVEVWNAAWCSGRQRCVRAQESAAGTDQLRTARTDQWQLLSTS